MHPFPTLIDSCTAFTLDALNAAQARTTEALQTSSNTALVKTLQMVQLQKVVSAVGMFSIFDALLQDRLKCAEGFKGAADILKDQGAADLEARFETLKLSINVLKHGKGRSYEELLKRDLLPFKLKQPGENFFNEGDMAEVPTLIEVDDAFVMTCAATIHEVVSAIRKTHPNFVA
jgi:hypothetical protein